MISNPFLSYSIAMVTPFKEDGSLDKRGIQELMSYYVSKQIPALLISGSTGEQHSMTVQERIELYHEANRLAQGKLLLYGGVASTVTKDAVRLALEAEYANLSAIMLGFPPYIRPSQDEVYHYVKAVCDATNLPIMLYNNPARNGFNLEVETLLRLVHDFPQIVALKEAGDPDHVMTTKTQLGKHFKILSGSDVSIVDYYEKGYEGITSVMGNILPDEMRLVVKLLDDHNIEQATIELGKMNEQMNLIFQIGAIKTIKFILSDQGINAGYCREPLGKLTLQEQQLVHRTFLG
ncbi:dihydrodipicolinate synthase family protein [Paenibacillus segetis]|uniref:4-hydroxy-tetrahydrodipicolinate synthase n=1 Tax=Paenibacillus segetis TaxID=1325360 RepID=A0ABQ1Y8I2_9BACL|nr:dihydrodipicolinate synthase family protein [Paenibacillus segetis]GGH15482.1 4-hydroxy-tetrahydrodipicolinate synthase [Paenibacillus segetis]